MIRECEREGIRLAPFVAREHAHGVDSRQVRAWFDRVSWRRLPVRLRRAAAWVAAVLLVIVTIIGVATRDSGRPPPTGSTSGAGTAVCGYDHRVPGNALLAGGHAPGGIVAIAPRGAIPPIDKPRFETPGEAVRWLGPDAPVIVVRVGEHVRAYPSAILLWHEVVNDVVGGRPLVVTFCALCNTAAVYERTIDGTVHRFGVSGELLLGAAVLLDRTDETTYSQPTGRQVGGPRQTKPLDWYPSDLMTLEQARSANPGLQVLSRNTGYERDYGTSPYPRTGRPGTVPGLFDGFVDARLEPKTRLVGTVINGLAQAWLYDELRNTDVRNDVVAGRPVVVLFRPETRSVADTANLANAPAVGSAGVFDARVGDQVLHFERIENGTIRDRETGSAWNRSGLAITGPLAGARLAPRAHLDTYWYIWAARHPDTRVWPQLPPGTCSIDGRGP